MGIGFLRNDNLKLNGDNQYYFILPDLGNPMLFVSGKIKKYYLLVLCVFLFFTGTFFHPEGIDRYSEFNNAVYLGIFLKFLFFIICIYSWGGVIAEYFGFKNDAVIILFFSLLFGMLLPAMCSFFTIFKIEFKFYYISVLLIGPAICTLRGTNISSIFSFWFQGAHARGGSFRSIELVLKYFLLFLFAVLFLKASIPSLNMDPLYYGMRFSKKLIETGEINYNQFFYMDFNATLWEIFQAWSFILVGSHESKGLLEALVFNQWLHVTYGILGGTLLLSRLAGFFKLSSAFVFAPLLAMIALYDNNSMIFTTYSAKNDWGYILFTLYGLFFLMRTEKTLRSDIVLAGLSFGLAFALKYVSVFFTAPLIAMMILYPDGEKI